MSEAQQRYFFDSGVRFQCRQCGRCCTGAPGTVYVAADELAPIAALLGTAPADLIGECLHPFRDSYSIREHPDGRCRFYEDGCRIYAARPRQCRTFPFWPENMRSERNWQRTCAACPGIGAGALYGRERILNMLAEQLP